MCAHAKTYKPRVALEETLAEAGHAIIKITVILVLGFLPFAISGHETARMMGTLLPLTFVVALLADLFLLPARVQLGLVRFESRATQ